MSTAPAWPAEAEPHREAVCVSRIGRARDGRSPGASQRHASQSIHNESTKMFPGSFSGRREARAVGACVRRMCGCRVVLGPVGEMCESGVTHFHKPFSRSVMRLRAVCFGYYGEIRETYRYPSCEGGVMPHWYLAPWT